MPNFSRKWSIIFCKNFTVSVSNLNQMPISCHCSLSETHSFLCESIGLPMRRSFCEFTSCNHSSSSSSVPQRCIFAQGFTFSRSRSFIYQHDSASHIVSSDDIPTHPPTHPLFQHIMIRKWEKVKICSDALQGEVLYRCAIRSVPESIQNSKKKRSTMKPLFIIFEKRTKIKSEKIIETSWISVPYPIQILTKNSVT